MIKLNRVNLRAIEDSDITAYHSWINDEETNFWRGVYHPHSHNDSLEELQRFAKRDSSSLTLMIVNESGLQIGLIGLRGICARSRRAEIWVYIGNKGFWSKGFGQESMTGLIKYAFDEMNLHRIWLECDPNHLSAVRCYEKIGFKKEGVLVDGYYRHGKFHNTMIMGLVRTSAT